MRAAISAIDYNQVNAYITSILLELIESNQPYYIKNLDSGCSKLGLKHDGFNPRNI